MRTLGVLIALFAVVGCGGDEPADPRVDTAALCAATVMWNGVVYFGTSVDEPVGFGASLGEGIRPGCRDTDPPDVDVRDEAVNVVEVARVPSSVAVGLAGEPSVYLAPGYLVTSPEHPLHDTLFGSASKPDEEAGFDCGASVRTRARAANTPGPEVFLVRSADEAGKELLGRHDDTVFTDAQTVVRGLVRDGIPYVGEGDEFDLVVRACTGGHGERFLVADRLEG